MYGLKAGNTKEGCKPDGRDNWAPRAGQAPFDKPALKPYWGVTRRALLLDCAHDTSHRDFHVVIDSRSVSRKKRDRDTGLCRQNRVSRCWKSPRGAPGKGRRADVAWILRGASAQKPIRLFWGIGEPARVWESGGLWTGRISRVRILASALGPALDRQAGFTAARPAAKSELQRQTVLTVVPEDRSLLTGAADGELSGASRTF